MESEDIFMAEILDGLDEYLKKEKVFVQNPERVREINKALNIAKNLFSHCEVKIKDDPLQMGSLILSIEGFDMVVRGQREIDLFAEMVEHADNFEVYPISNGNIRFAAVFQNALKRI